MPSATPTPIPLPTANAGLPDQEMEYCCSYSFCCPLFKIDGAKLSGGISRYDLVGGNVFGHDTACTYNCIFTDGHFGKDGRTGTDGCAFFDHRYFNMPIFLGLQPAI